MANYADILVQYQTEIDSFLEALHRIDNEHGSFVCIGTDGKVYNAARCSAPIGIIMED